jgi:hypothetical protein
MRPRKNWLKSLGFADEKRRVPDRWDSERDGLLRRAVAFPQKPDVQPGDGIVMYASGTGLFFAAAEATSYPYKEGDSDWPWHVDVEIVASVNFVRHGIPLETIAVDGREHNVRIRRRSHVNLTNTEFEAAVDALRRAGGNA